MYMTTAMNEFLEEDNIQFSVFGVNIGGLYGEFGDGEKWGFTYDQIYKDDSYTTLAKHSDDEEENKKLDVILDTVKAVLSSDKNDSMDAKVKLIVNELDNVQAEDPETIYFYCCWDGIRGTFKDGTQWGYSYDELS